MNLVNELSEEARLYIQRIRGQAAYLSSPEIKKILATVGYLAEKYSLEVYKAVGGYDTRIYLTAKDLTGLKDPALASMLETLVHSEPKHMSTTDTPSSFSRSYTFKWEAHDYESGIFQQLQVVITAQFKEDSETCKRVIVGYTKPSDEPTPIYEIQCSDPDTPPADAEPVDPRLTHL